MAAVERLGLRWVSLGNPPACPTAAPPRLGPDASFHSPADATPRLGRPPAQGEGRATSCRHGQRAAHRPAPGSCVPAVTMVKDETYSHSKYSKWFSKEDTAAMPRARVTRCLVHYKKMREVAAAIRGMNIHEAIAYLNRVLEKQAGIPARVHTGGCGRHGVGKLVNAPGNCVMFPTKPTKAMIWILNNVLAGKTCEKLDDTERAALVLAHVQVNRSPKMRRRTYRAHGRISAYMRSPCHVEVIAKPRDMTVPSEAGKEEAEAAKRLTRKSMARLRLRLGQGATA
ncbi:hypothetical protein FNF29_00449 [Cafeteria roenbergensis]|uniref:Ribosomal protein L22 n=1 Tax=Cafeteria roenbergensis TaxID=33653 RepID=A0A5A8CXD9_CAFRO|nr:hypothetical protein FNF29_00449 [Cafeteria roenbergensis]|eukprot:KAA0157097.1 hypothetical protein FNF29_00449 [Cafeteria roenbergensis]